MSYTETELSDLIKSVEKEFSAHLSLAKSEGFPEKKEEPKDEQPEEKEEVKEEPKEESEDESHEAPSEEGDEQQEEHSEGPPQEGEEEHSEGEEMPPSEEGQGHDYDDEDMEHMHKMYSSMHSGELKAHHDCIKNCLDAHKEGPPMEKSEVTEAIDIPEVKNEEVALLKSEVAAEKEKAEKLQKSLDTVTAILTKMVTKTVPAAKSITSLEVINKSELGNDKTLSKSEITAKLTAAASRPDLAKSDRDAINAFYLGTNPNLESISHLLK